SRYSKAALERALALARDFQSELLVLSVMDAPPGFGQEAPQVATEILGGLRKLVQDAARKAASQGVECRTWVWEGSVYRSIVELARMEQAGFIVLGSHGRTGLKRLLMGSVTERVIGHAGCPVLVVKLKR
ncbi:MAG: universal stress protein, partial [Deltaproteobacteria bacterium]|nr:universal stress protein [Deltaproteobacteria bacterium]